MGRQCLTHPLGQIRCQRVIGRVERKKGGGRGWPVPPIGAQAANVPCPHVELKKIARPLAHSVQPTGLLIGAKGMPQYRWQCSCNARLLSHTHFEPLILAA